MTFLTSARLYDFLCARSHPERPAPPKKKTLLLILSRCSLRARRRQLSEQGDHFSLAFDKPGTRSQKYNLIWWRPLRPNLFPAEIAPREIGFYKRKQYAYGLPLDSRETYAKLDWIVWTATLAESESDLRAFVLPAYRFAHETPDRVPLTDWYVTTDGRQRGFQARSVVVGVYIRMLADEALWQKWSRRAGS